MTIEAVSFPLNREPEGAALTYRPWGTRTLKLWVTTDTAIETALRIRPSRIHQKTGDKGLIRAYADDSDAFIISWGGGHEPGPCLKSKDVLKAFESCTGLAAGDASVIFFNVTHAGPDVPDEAIVTIEAYDEKSGDVFASLPVTLSKPASFPDNAIQFRQTEQGVWQPQGEMLPVYDPRWWPREIAYVAAGALPLTIRQQGETLSIQWQGQESATITDETKPTILGSAGMKFELFHFDEWHVALRTWFFWLDTAIGGDFFVGRHEVPDAERFDFLIRRGDGKVTLACTDLHWREVWGETTERPQRATLGLGRDAKMTLAEEKMGDLWHAWKRKKEADHARSYNPIRFIKRLANMHGRQLTDTDRAKGTEAHLPMLHNVEQRVEENEPPPMTSSDVRLG